MRRWPAVAGWVAGCLALTAIFVRISLGARVMSDGGTIALQSWDMLHGHLLLHGWQVSDLNCYFIELPVIAVAEGIFGLGDFAQHVGSSLTYMLVAVVAIATAMTGSYGAARAVRAGVVLAVLAAPLFAGTMYLVVEEPDHIGTSIIIIGSFLLIDRFAGRRFTAPLLLVILTAGQFDDLTVRYFAVPAIVLVCAYRAIADRSWRSPDAVVAYTALVSVPLSALFSWLWVHIGGFITPSLWQGVSPARLWPHHVRVTAANIRILYGAANASHVAPGAKAYFGLACLLAAVLGMALVAWRWRRASRAEQMIAVAVVCTVAVYVPTGFAYPGNAHDLALLLPAGAVLAARALTPERIRNTRAAIASVAAVALIAALPLAYAATRPAFQPVKAPLAAFLESHKLTYGLGTYDDGPTLTVLTHNQVQLIPVHTGYNTFAPYTFESKQDWYVASHHDANFVVARPDLQLPPSLVVRYFGKPAETYKLDNWVIMVYKKNLLKELSAR
ncbi:MAG TPA: hypothetical protein VHV09_12080 [Trebonia sp.]|nr:hypothetical protein [Trebonia sp.]